MLGHLVVQDKIHRAVKRFCVCGSSEILLQITQNRLSLSVMAGVKILY